jgi:hypothetical protein
LDGLVPQQPCRKEPFIRNAISRDKSGLKAGTLGD